MLSWKISRKMGSEEVAETMMLRERGAECVCRCTACVRMRLEPCISPCAGAQLAHEWRGGALYCLGGRLHGNGPASVLTMIFCFYPCDSTLL